MSDVIEIGGTTVRPGERATIQLEVARLYDYTEIKLPISVIRGRKTGPTLFLSAALHGDEINGTEIIKRVLAMRQMRRLHGTLIAVPIVNVFGFNNRSRYLPDRRDLNRSFPGAENGSLAARLAHLLMKHVVEQSDFGIDLHTAAVHRTNLPQIRANLNDGELRELATAFGAPVMLNSPVREGSLREAATSMGVPVLLYEGGEALRFDEFSIRVGVQGIISLMRHIGMLDGRRERKRRNGWEAVSSYWVRAPHSGILRIKNRIGSKVEEDAMLGEISNHFNEEVVEVRARQSGIIIGQMQLPLVNRGDALFHVATFRDLDRIDADIIPLEDFQRGDDYPDS